MTLGAEGCWVQAAGEKGWTVPARAVQVVDTTAAGDTFAGALAAMIGAGSSLQEAVEQAVAAASLACTRSGAQPSIPTLEKVRKWIAGQGVAGGNGG